VADRALSVDVRSRFEELVDIAPERREDFAPFIPSFEFVLEDLSERQSKELHEMATTALARLALFCLKEVREGAPFLEALPDWADIYSELGRWSECVIDASGLADVFGD